MNCVLLPVSTEENQESKLRDSRLAVLDSKVPELAGPSWLCIKPADWNWKSNH